MEFIPGRVNTTIRVRPRASESGSTPDCFRYDNSTDPITLTIKGLDRGEKRERLFTADHILMDETSQQECYDTVAAPLVASVIEGYHGTIIAYGESASGKTYSILGRQVTTENKINFHTDPACEGIFPRAVRHILAWKEQAPAQEQLVLEMSFFQIYKEKINDLLSPERKILELHEDPKEGFFVEDLPRHPIKDMRTFLRLLIEGYSRRATSPTLINEVSSRSHAVLVLHVTRTISGEGWSAQARTFGRLYCVDLAGSECAKFNTGERLEENKFINVSLNALGNVIAALSNPKRAHIPFRDSKLTKILQSSLIGNCRAAILCTVRYKEDIFETVNTLHFAARSRKIKLSAHPNKVIDYQVLCLELKNQLKKRSNQIVSLRSRLSKYEPVEDDIPTESNVFLEAVDSFLRDRSYHELSHMVDNLESSRQNRHQLVDELDSIYQDLITE